MIKRAAFTTILAAILAVAFTAQAAVVRTTLSSGIGQSASVKCGRCHAAQLSLWIGHVHSRFLLHPDKDRARIEARWGEKVPGWKEFVEGNFTREDVDLAYGVIEFQIYLEKGLDGVHRLLPAQWNIKERRWTLLAKPLEALRLEKKSWEANCAGCHVTGLDNRTGTYVEKNVACEGCHGDGTTHADSGGRKKILNPGKIDAVRRTEICGRCHTRGLGKEGKRNWPDEFIPGETRLSEVFVPAQPVPGETTQYFWPEGTERTFFMEYQGFMQSGHSEAGLSCTTCHLPHGSDQPRGLRRKVGEICLDCHDKLPEVAAHVEHPGGKASCVDCHMSVINPDSEALKAHTHSLRFLSPENALKYGTPDSCIQKCHDDRDSNWSMGIMYGWAR